jgi:hypothetical protein
VFFNNRRSVRSDSWSAIRAALGGVLPARRCHPQPSDIQRLQEAPIDYLPGLSSEAKRSSVAPQLPELSLQIAQAHPDVIPFYQTRTHGLYGVGN